VAPILLGLCMMSDSLQQSKKKSKQVRTESKMKNRQ